MGKDLCYCPCDKCATNPVREKVSRRTKRRHLNPPPTLADAQPVYNTAKDTTEAKISDAKEEKEEKHDEAIDRYDPDVFPINNIDIDDIDVPQPPQPAAARKPNGRPKKPTINLNVPLCHNARKNTRDVIIDLFNIQVRHSIPKAALKKILKVIQIALPVDHTLPDFAECERSLTTSLNKPTKTDTCINDCVIYCDAPKLHIYYSHSTTCPVCREPRYDKYGNSRKVFQHFSLEDCLQNTFSKPEVARYMRLIQPQNPYNKRKTKSDPIKSLYESKRWFELVLNDEDVMSNDRNVMLSISTDGFNPFRKRDYSLWPIVLTILNLPEHLRNKVSNMILIGLVPGPSKPKNIQCYLVPLINELLTAECATTRFKIFDSFTGTHHEIFARILFSVADNPACSLLNCQQGAGASEGCMKCYCSGVKDIRAGTVIYQCMGKKHEDVNFWNRDPKSKTHEHYLSLGEEITYRRSVQLQYYDTYAKKPEVRINPVNMKKIHKSMKDDFKDCYGVTGESRLCWLPNFDMRRDSMIDPMHVKQGIVKTHAINLFGGNRKVDLNSNGFNKLPRGYKFPDGQVKEDVKPQQNSWVLSAKEQREVDAIYMSLCGPAGLFPTSIIPFQRTGRFTASNVLTLVRVYGKFIFSQSFKSQSEDEKVAADGQLKLQIWCDLLTCIEKICRRTISEKFIEKLEKELTTLMKMWEKHVPCTEHTMIIHSLIHIPQQMKDWGPVRSYWAYANERFLGALARGVHGRRFLESHIMAIARTIMTVPYDNVADIKPLIDIEDATGDNTYDRFHTQMQFPHHKPKRRVPVDNDALHQLLANTNDQFHALYTAFKSYNKVLQNQHRIQLNLKEWSDVEGQCTAASKQFIQGFPSSVADAYTAAVVWKGISYTTMMYEHNQPTRITSCHAFRIFSTFVDPYAEVRDYYYGQIHYWISIKHPSFEDPMLLAYVDLFKSIQKQPITNIPIINVNHPLPFKYVWIKHIDEPMIFAKHTNVILNQRPSAEQSSQRFVMIATAETDDY